jgi:hypothetical protein
MGSLHACGDSGGLRVRLRSCGAGLEVDGGGFVDLRQIEFVQEELDGALGFVGVELGGRGDEAVLGVVDDLGDGLGGLIAGVGFGEVEAGDLEAVEEQAGAAGVDLVGGDAAEDFADGLLDGRAVFGVGEGEAGLAALARGRVLDGAAGVVVVVAEGFGALGAADGGAAAAAAVGEEMAALVLGGFGGQDFGVHLFSS